MKFVFHRGSLFLLLLLALGTILVFGFALLGQVDVLAIMNRYH